MAMFWLFSGLAAALAALAILSAARRGVATSAGPAEDARLLSELDALRDRGLLEPEAWAAARAEAGRRILAQASEPMALRDPPWLRAGLLSGLVATAGGALALYVATGSPGAPDEPYRGRVDAWATELETLDPPRLAAVAARVTEARPRDRDAQVFLGRARFEAGDPIGAASAIRRALALEPDDAVNWARLGEALTVAGQGEVGIDAEAAFAESLKRDPSNQGARYFLGRAALARGDAARATALWTPLLGQLDVADPRRARLEAELQAAANR